VKTAVVSNKPDIAVQKLAEEIFPGSFDVSIGELPEVRRKPAPDMTDKALRILGVNREDAVYIGDSEVDMQTAEASGLPCISVSWGFRGRQFLKKHHASIIIDRPEELVREIL
jgi:phosphoglycolate phosphatase